MSSIAHPNWLAIGAAFFTLFGVFLLAKSYLQGVPAGPDAAREAAFKRVNSMVGVPLLGTGLFLHAISQMLTSSLTPLIVVVLLGLAFAMLLFASLEHTLADRLLQEPEAVRRPRLALLPPAQPDISAVEVDIIAVEIAR